MILETIVGFQFELTYKLYVCDCGFREEYGITRRQFYVFVLVYSDTGVTC